MFVYTHIYILDTGNLLGWFRKGQIFPTDVQLDTIHSLLLFESSLLIVSDWQEFASGKNGGHSSGAFLN